MPDRAPPTLARGEPAYPAALLDLPDPPPVLHVRGAWPRGAAIAIVGSRAATPYGMAFAHRLARDLAALGVVVVSGLARGIDAAAHRGALDAGGATVAVLPGSLSPVSPAHHADLADEIAGHGALVAEWDVGMSPSRGLFIRRNRLIAALGRATVVVEAASRSGALATARIARELGRTVLAVPGDVDRPTSRGVIGLLRHGAQVCEHAGDVLRVSGLASGASPSVESGAPRGATRRGVESPGPRSAPVVPTADTPLAASIATGIAIAISTSVSDTARLAAGLPDTPAPLEALARVCAVPIERAMAALLDLEWSGVATRHPGQRWSRRVEPE